MGTPLVLEIPITHAEITRDYAVAQARADARRQDLTVVGLPIVERRPGANAAQPAAAPVEVWHIELPVEPA
jgi:hypothetical protein